jgi:phosphoribosylaminoimidazole-succinocarboxamide synthase
MIRKLEQMYEGKAKKVFRTDNPLLLIQEFKDDATAFNAKKRGTIVGKGIVNNKISSSLFTLLEKEGVPTHFIERLSDREMVVKKLEIIPVEVTVRNITAGGICRLLGIKEGIRLEKPVLEWHYKSDSLDDPLINDDHIEALGVATRAEMKLVSEYTLKINQVLIAFFSKLGIDLVDFKLEFGRHQGQILLGDEISPDTCRFWEKGTGKKLDKDRFRQDLGGVEDAYQEMLARVGA